MLPYMEELKDDSLDIPILETERLRLRPLSRTDIDDYAALNAHRAVVRHLLDNGVWDRGRSWRHRPSSWGTGNSEAPACGRWS